MINTMIILSNFDKKKNLSIRNKKILYLKCRKESFLNTSKLYDNTENKNLINKCEIKKGKKEYLDDYIFCNNKISRFDPLYF